MPTKNTPSSFRLGSELEEEISQLAASLDISRSQLVKKAVKHFIARQKHIDAVLAKARESYAAYKTTGLGVPWSEASAWMQNGGGDTGIPTVRNMRK